MECCNYPFPPPLGNIITGEVYSGDNGIDDDDDDDDDMDGNDDNDNNNSNGNDFP